MPLIDHTKSPKPQLARTVSYPYRAHGTRLPAARQSNNLNPAGLMTAVIGMVLLFVGSITLVSLFSGEPNESAAIVSKQPVEEKAEEVKKIDFTAMNASINAVIAENSFETGVAIIDIKTGDSQTYGAPEPFMAASTAKLLTAIAYLRDVEQGKHSLTEQVGDKAAEQALEALIVESDNAAWTTLNKYVLSHAELAALAADIGLENYNPTNNTIPAASVAKLLSELYQNKLLNGSHTNLLLSYMQRAKEVEYISSIIPAGVKIYHKPGYLSDRVHDATIIDNGSRPYVLVVFTKSKSGYYDQQLGSSVFQRIAQATFTTFITNN